MTSAASPAASAHGFLELELQCAQGLAFPPDLPLRDWVAAALLRADPAGPAVSLGIRLVDAEESGRLNLAYRGKAGPTNVLAFPAPALPALPAGEPRVLGDLVVCAPLVEAEASAQGKTWKAHFAHLLVHGSLHLAGFDHDNESAARVMESLETDIMDSLGFPDPYADQELTDDERSE